MQIKKFYKKFFLITILISISLIFLIISLIDFRTKHSLKISLKKNLALDQQPIINNLGFYISTNSKDIFSFKEDDQIFIYTNINGIHNLEISGFSDHEKICFKNKFKFNTKINFTDILNNCSKAFLFRGKIKYKNEQISFFFTRHLNNALDQKNLIIIPTSYLFLIYNNVFLLNQNDLENIEYPFVASSKNFPMIIGEIEDYDYLLKSLQFFLKLSKKNTFIYDFQLKNINLENFDNLIFPHHQEYIEKEAIKKIDKFLKINNKSKTIISVGESFKHLYKFDNNKSFFEMYPSDSNYTNYDFVTDVKEINLISKNCFFESYKIHGIYVDFRARTTKKKFFELKCAEEKLPLISEIKYNENKFINFNQEYLIHLISPKSDIFKYLKNLIE